MTWRPSIIAYLVLSLSSTVLTWIVARQTEHAITLSVGALATVTMLATFSEKLLGLFAPSLSNAVSLAHARLINSRQDTPLPPKPPSVPPVIAATMMVFAAMFMLSCSASQQQQVEQPGTATAVCILTVTIPDVLAGKPWQTVLVDNLKTCGADATAVASVYGAHVRGEILEGKTPLALPPDAPSLLDAGTDQ